MTEIAQELKRANDLKEQELRVLIAIANKPTPKNILQTISKWWADEKAYSMQNHY